VAQNCLEVQPPSAFGPVIVILTLGVRLLGLDGVCGPVDEEIEISRSHTGNDLASFLHKEYLPVLAVLQRVAISVKSPMEMGKI
jgi:hypothetical protein